ncbi:UL34 membrane phosphoprotein [Meleagrid alphaherpesvirus 1]|uniref:UL34 membrane phosphoprotein n=1 Tax=Meleagrid herpesvirus 1 TaxID=37108 RepID=Q9DPQ5_MEHV1|nr:nuclear egress membrane protein [Meleagrid alphaherpesvirus 1]AKQ48630.1 nuclear egress membrane protein [iBAC vector pMeHV1-C7]AKQ48702.1 nuclear egress membrane protein [iBAC vector pMeHV1-C9]AKQ48774.1 nuclear egress membrane protein [iBAC vector pMeHV1-C10]AKQ48846.1 nuclear egress membrane protein [iBAC vector pMeHV1-C17]AKQ48919.1 nuclear egress membrane protein [iBAC vector pMeHV1-C18]
MDNPPTVNNRRGGLIARIKLVVGGHLSTGNYDHVIAEPFSGYVPSRCVFQFSGADGVESAFPVEYIMRMMSDWAENECDPYIKIQNTGVSVLIEGFFNPPINAAKAPLVDKINILLNTTDSTGIALSDINRIKQFTGVDCRPFQACLNVNCFVRLPSVQLAFRFVGPSDPSRTSRLLDSAVGAFDNKRRLRRNGLPCAENKPEYNTSQGCVPIPLIDDIQKSNMATSNAARRILNMFKAFSSTEYVTTVRISRCMIILLLVGVILTATVWAIYVYRV